MPAHVCVVVDVAGAALLLLEDQLGSGGPGGQGPGGAFLPHVGPPRLPSAALPVAAAGPAAVHLRVPVVCRPNRRGVPPQPARRTMRSKSAGEATSTSHL